MKITKKMLQACKMLVTDVTEKDRAAVGAFYDSDTGKLCIINRHCGYVFSDDLTDDDKQRIIDICGVTKSKAFCGMFHDDDENEYPMDWVEIIQIDELQKSVSDLKKMDEWKKYRNINVMLNHNFNTYYNKMILLETAKCLDGKSIVAHFPVKSTYPIIITGKYGKGLVLPVMRNY